MIKKFKQPTIYIFFSIIVFMFLLPKELIYNVFEKELSKYEIVISNEIRDENFSLDILKLRKSSLIITSRLIISKVRNYRAHNANCVF